MLIQIFEDTNNRNSFTERLSDNSNNQRFDVNLKITDQKSISIQNNRSNYGNLQNNQNSIILHVSISLSDSNVFQYLSCGLRYLFSSLISHGFQYLLTHVSPFLVTNFI